MIRRSGGNISKLSSMANFLKITKIHSQPNSSELENKLHKPNKPCKAKETKHHPQTKNKNEPHTTE